MRIKRDKIVYPLSHADILNGKLQLIGYCKHYAALCGSVKLCENYAGYAGGLEKLLCLDKSVLPRRCVKQDCGIVITFSIV